jgi:hypothetical protein
MMGRAWQNRDAHLKVPTKEAEEGAWDKAQTQEHAPGDLLPLTVSTTFQ